MDVNGTHFRILIEPAEFGTLGPELAFCPERRHLRLATAHALRLPKRNVASALTAWGNARPLILDRHSQVGLIAEDGLSIVVDTSTGLEASLEAVLDAEGAEVAPPSGQRFVDLCLGGEGRLAAICTNDADEHALVSFHLRHRWKLDCALPEVPRRVCCDPHNRYWVVGDQSLLRLSGSPLPQPYIPVAAGFSPVRVNPHPLHIEFTSNLPAHLTVMALAVDATHVVVLALREDQIQVLLVFRQAAGPGAAPAVIVLDATLPCFTDLALVGPLQVVLIAPVSASDAAEFRHDAALFELVLDAAIPVARLVRQRWPLRPLGAARFASSSDGAVRYQAVDGPTRLVPLPITRFEPEGELIVNRLDAQGVAQPALLDSGTSQCVWHRVFVEAKIPSGCALEIFARVGDTADVANAAAWQRQPDLVWQSRPSELAWHPGLVERDPGTAGLFETLLQYETGNVRRMAGRYLQLKLHLRGDGQNSPTLACLRAYFQRFCYQENYLPRHFHQQELRTDGEAPANGADLRERYFAVFESALSELEGRIANAEILADPRSAPAWILPTLAQLTASQPDPDWPEARVRRWIAAAGILQQMHGTVRGVRLGLDIVSDGAVARGQITVIENWRLRRTMATFLGVDREDTHHPLTLGTMLSGNSIVGDSLILSETAARAYLELLDPSLHTASIANAVQAFFDRYAHTVTILLHGAAKAQRATIERVLPRLMPAHLQWQILTPENSFVIGLSPLLAVDTFLDPTPAPREVVLGNTWLGREGLLTNPEALIPYVVSDVVSLS